MAQSLAETVFPWAATDVWPPRAAASSGDSFEVEGTVQRHYPLNVRKANEQQGFLKSAVTNDVNVKFRALELRLHSLKNLRTGASISISNAAQCFAQFISLAAGSGNAAAASQLQPSKDGVLTFWADATLASDLSAKADGRPIDLSNALVRVTTEGATLVARTVDLLKSAAENKPATTSYSGHPNLLAAAGAQYNPAAVAAMGAKNAANKAKDNDEEWDD